MPTTTLEMEDLQVNFSKFLEEVRQQDHEVILSEKGNPIARVTPMPPIELPVTPRRMPGQLEGKITILGDINEPLPISLNFDGKGVVNGKRIGGVDNGKFVVPDDFNEPMSPCEEELWYQ